MIIYVHCFGQIRTLTKERMVEMTLINQTSIPAALDEFVKMYGDALEELLYNEGKLRGFYSIQVDKEHVKDENLEDYNLQDGQTIAIIPFIAGG